MFDTIGLPEVAKGLGEGIRPLKESLKGDA
jgi:mttA/Hcf106 family protein